LKHRLSGLYLVVDPTIPSQRLLKVVSGGLEGGVDVVQVWYAWKDREPNTETVRRVKDLTSGYGVPLLINNDVTMARLVGADGVHMDGYELGVEEIREELGGHGIVGYTVGNDIPRVTWAESAGADYVSFCSVFPSKSVINCEVVSLETIRRARELTNISIFASGGITAANAATAVLAGADGVAVISAIQDSENPEEAARKLKTTIASAFHPRS